MQQKEWLLNLVLLFNLESDMFEYEIMYEYYDYFFTHQHIKAMYFVRADSIEEDKKKAYWALGSCIDILNVEQFN